MKILHKITLLLLLFVLFNCKNESKIDGTWIFGSTDSISSTLDIQNGLIVSNGYSPFNEIAKFHLQGSKLVIDSGAILLAYYYFMDSSTFQWKINKNELILSYESKDLQTSHTFIKSDSIPLLDRLLPELIVNIDLPIMDCNETIDLMQTGLVYLGKPKQKFKGSYGDRYFMQLNDALSNPGDIIILDYMSQSDTQIGIICDSKMPMIYLDSLRYNLRTEYNLLGVLNLDTTFSYLKTDATYFCNCGINREIPPPPIELIRNCKHSKYYSDKSDYNFIRIDSLGNYFFNNKQLPRSKNNSILNELFAQIDNPTYFLVYDNMTPFESYSKIYCDLNNSFNRYSKDSTSELTIIDINDNDLKFIKDNF